MLIAKGKISTMERNNFKTDSDFMGVFFSKQDNETQCRPVTYIVI